MHLCWTWRECPETVAYGTPRKLCDYRCNFETIEVLLSHLFQNPLECTVDVRCSNSTEDHYFYFSGNEEEVPPSSMDLSIERKAIETFDHAPVS